MVPLPFALGALAPAGTPFGAFAMTSLAAIAALLGGFYDADNDSTGEESDAPAAAKDKAAPQARRIAAGAPEEEDEEELLGDSEKKRSKK
jgi:hypothetical protein